VACDRIDHYFSPALAAHETNVDESEMGGIIPQPGSRWVGWAIGMSRLNSAVSTSSISSVTTIEALEMAPLLLELAETLEFFQGVPAGQALMPVQRVEDLLRPLFRFIGAMSIFRRVSTSHIHAGIPNGMEESMHPPSNQSCQNKPVPGSKLLESKSKGM
jgi:hypothetical protein